MTILKCGSEGVHLELYPGARGHTHTQFYLARDENELGSFSLSSTWKYILPYKQAESPTVFSNMGD